MNLKEIKEMINLMNENGLEELEIEREGMKVKIKRSPPNGSQQVSSRPNEFQVEASPSTQKEEEKTDPGTSSDTGSHQSM